MEHNQPMSVLELFCCVVAAIVNILIQVAALLHSLSIDPGSLPAELPHQAAPAQWAAIWEGQAARGHPPEPLVGADVAAAHAHAAAARAAAAGAGPAAWDGIWQQQQQMQMQRPVSTGWADEFAVQRQQQAGPGAWAEEFTQQEGGTSSDWVQGFAQEQEEAAASRHGSTAATADAQATSARLVAALTADGDPKMKNSKFLQFLSKMSKGELMFEDNKVC
jgi:peroxin-5